MIHELKKTAMVPVAQPSRRLTRHDWNKIEISLMSAMLSKASAQPSAAQKALVQS